MGCYKSLCLDCHKGEKLYEKATCTRNTFIRPVAATSEILPIYYISVYERCLIEHFAPLEILSLIKQLSVMFSQRSAS